MANPAPPFTGVDLQEMFDNDPDLQAQIKAQEREYGHYVANQHIYAGNALAYAPGHQVPVANVVLHGYWFNNQVDLVEGKDHPQEMRVLIGEREAREAKAAAQSKAPPIDDEDADTVVAEGGM
jgi:hypothetical protein